MIKPIHQVLCTFSLILLVACNQGPKDTAGKQTELRTTQTLGLAYLEEFKFAEAEKEFLKFIKLAPEEKLGYANLGLTYLRMGKYPEAEKRLEKAISIDPADPDIRLILATVFQMNDKKADAATQLKEAHRLAPGHIKVLYALTEFYSAVSDHSSGSERKEYMQALAEKAPGNLVPLLGLTELRIRDGEPEKAVELLETIRKQFPDFPKESTEFFNKTLSLLRQKDTGNALHPFSIFHNYLKVSNPYQAGMIDLKGPGGSLIGFPLITFDGQGTRQVSDDVPVADFIRFTDVTESAGLNLFSAPSPGTAGDHGVTAFSVATDYDSDGDIDLLTVVSGQGSKNGQLHLLNNDMGRFRDVTRETRLPDGEKVISAAFADYDNDGFLDLFMSAEKAVFLFRNAGVGEFKEVTSASGLREGGRNPLFFDFDHDGDLDLLEMGKTACLAFRNNGDGTFREQAAEMGLTANGEFPPTDASFADFDDDGDIDFAVAHEKGGIVLWSNLRQGRFSNITSQSGLDGITGTSAVAAGDYNNDGFPDLFFASPEGREYLFTNKGNAIFEKSVTSEEMTTALQGLKALDARFLDFDNDGYLDLLVAGEPVQEQARGIVLLRNDRNGRFRDVSSLIPMNLRSGRQITIFDYNDDGDPDLLIAGTDGSITLLRNDGGNMNHYVKMKLVGLKAGSAKNNHFGIGARVELRAGDLYQTMVVTEPEIHFGLGKQSRADIIRITWTNGVPQNIFLPGADQALIEAQTLKGSCPFLYAWNGKEFEFIKDITWRSALGMPMGIMGGTTRYAFADASDDYLKIPGELLKPVNGAFELRITSELWETIYMDKVELVAVDHPDSVDVFVPEQFTPPPFPGMKLYPVTTKHLPVSATDSNGNNLLPLLENKDDRYIAGFEPNKYQGITEMQELILDPGKAGQLKNLCLFMTGWIFPTDASINAALSQSEKIKVMPPVIQVKNRSGEWQTVVDFFGFPMGKDKTVIVELADKFLSADHTIRILTNMEIYWDHIFFSESLPEETFQITPLDPVAAELRFRGFSQSFRKGGPYGPHWFDYQTVDTNVRWRDLTGNYTRYGDVTPLLLQPDNRYIISNAGDETALKFDAAALPALKPGWKRDFLIRSVGWVKDGDLNTWAGNTVLPLPFHGMKSYPPSESDRYPDSPELRKYNREYNTRIVTSDPFRNSFKTLTFQEK